MFLNGVTTFFSHYFTKIKKNKDGYMPGYTIDLGRVGDVPEVKELLNHCAVIREKGAQDSLDLNARIAYDQLEPLLNLQPEVLNRQTVKISDATLGASPWNAMNAIAETANNLLRPRP